MFEDRNPFNLQFTSLLGTIPIHWLDFAIAVVIDCSSQAFTQIVISKFHLLFSTFPFINYYFKRRK